MSNLRKADAGAIREAARLLRAGRLVAFPTETVYGLGADATNDRAVAAIFAAKGRPTFNPLIVHFTDADAARREAVFDARADALAHACWPGPLTLVLRRRDGCRLSRLVSAGLDTVALRVPATKIAHDLLTAVAVPIAAPSANRSGDLSPTTAEHVARSLGTAVDMILDGGPTPIGIESTVVDLSEECASLLRPGGLAAETIEALIGPLARPADDPAQAARRSPGRLARHYAPRTKLRADARTVAPDEALLAFGPGAIPGAETARALLNLSPSGNLDEAAANLFAYLHRLDAAGASAIACAPVPMDGLGAAINDRLVRAAEPLPETTESD